MEPRLLQGSDWRPAFDTVPTRWRIGLIALATDLTSERDFARMVPTPEVAIHAARVAYANPTTLENLRRMQPLLSEAAALLLPDEPLDAIAYSCTAASVAIGDGAVAAAIHAGKPGVPCVTPPAAARAGLRQLGVRRLSILTPYTPAVTAPVGRYFADHGFEVVGLTCLGQEDDRRMARIRPESVVEAALAACDANAEALFISCTALRAAEVAQAIEDRLGRPVVTSNQAMLWHSLRLAGCDMPIPGHGRLTREPLAVPA
jgi:maleate isomerase